MSSASPSPFAAAPPPTSISPPSQPSSAPLPPPPQGPNAPPPDPNSRSPTPFPPSTIPTPPPAPPTLPPPPQVNAPPPSSKPLPPNIPPPSFPPPLANPPPPSLPPPQPSSPPPPLSPSPPSWMVPPPPYSNPPISPFPPTNSPPPPPSSNPPISPFPPTNSPPPPPSSNPPTSPFPPTNPPPSPPSNNDPSPRLPPDNQPPPLTPNPSEISPPPPSSRPPQNPPPPTDVPPLNPPTPPTPSLFPPPSNPPPKPLLPPSFSPPSFLPPGNPRTNNPRGNAPESPRSSRGGGLGTGAIVAISLGGGLVLIVIFVACCVWNQKKKASGNNGGNSRPTLTGSSRKPGNDGTGSGHGVKHSPRAAGGFGNRTLLFKYEELVEATNGFSAKNILGKGGFGSVYKGILADGKEVAIKQLSNDGGQGEREFGSEVEIISRIHHRHLVGLVGYCISGERRLLVLDYLPNNTLYFHLHGEGPPVMDWATRVKVAVGAARGIAYLHEDCHPRVIHRDIKSSNILLTSDFEARVSDFGLAKSSVDTNSHISTKVVGTFGYMAPEYASSGKLTEKSDVYSFGVVLLELITGRKAVDGSQPMGDESLVDWSQSILSHAIQTEELGELPDPRLEGNYVHGDMLILIEAAAACVRYSAVQRPKMAQVVRSFDRMFMSDLRVGVDSVQQSKEIKLIQRMAFGSHELSSDFFTQGSSSSKLESSSSRRDVQPDAGRASNHEE